MKILKKILSNRGQLSMEIGILVAAAVLVAIFAGYIYISNVHKAASGVNQSASTFIKTANETANQYANVSKLFS